MLFFGVLLAAFLSAAEPATASGLPDTGQVSCYDASGLAVPCPAPGAPLAQDGSYSGHPLSYADNYDGTVTDNNTWLLWQGAETAPMDHASAMNHCSGLSLGGITGWRLPSRSELYGILDFGPEAGALANNAVFPGTSKLCYWSATAGAVSPESGAWNVDFGGGSSGIKPAATLCGVRCVYGTEHVAAFLDNGDGTVGDDANGLIWQRYAATQAMSWESALNYCESLTLGGYDDWRLPNVKELETSLDLSRIDPAVDVTVFPDAGGLAYWSSTSSSLPAFAASVNSGSGEVMTGTGKNSQLLMARCVRTRNLADVVLWLENAQKTVAARSTTSLMLTVTNNGPDVAQNVRLSGTIPTGSTLISAVTTSGSCLQNGLSLDCELGNLDFGMAAAVFVTMAAPSTTGSFPASFMLTTSNQDPDTGGNSAVWSLNVARIVRTLGVSITGSGFVSGDGIACPGDCSEAYADGVSVVIAAAPESGWAFRRWSGSMTGSVNPASVSMSANRSMAAVFEPDSDGDGAPDSIDNCPSTSNMDQKDADADGTGDACDSCKYDMRNDADSDGICGDVDTCPLDPDNDADGDGICGNIDNCPLSPNPDQGDGNADGIGDYCSKDVDLFPVSLEGPSVAAIGEAMKVEITVRNSGSYQAGRDFEVSLYLSSDGIVRSGDKPVRSILFRRGGGGLKKTWRGSVMIPPDTPAGYCYLVVAVDSGRLIAEINEINNTLAGNRIEITRNTPSINSIVIEKIMYNRVSGELAVYASSAYGSNAMLELAGIGPMSWEPEKRCWKIRVSGLAETSVRTITVRGAEGQAESSVVIR
ncbi:MAG: DUF1566 domain-containing protein [Nitrospirae bacterium]|nr:DUF1566 domain-containing protein [Nitrospirota bacterium]